MGSPDRLSRSLDAVAASLVAAILPSGVWAQAGAPEGTAAPAPAALSVLLVAMALVGIVVLAVKLFDVRRQRIEAAMLLQARLSDALMADPMLAGLPITPTAHVPVWRGSPVTVELTGRVPTLGLREAVLRLAIREVSAMRTDFRIEDHMAVAPSAARRAA